MRWSRHFLEQSRERRQHIAGEAGTLITFLGDEMAYDEAYTRALSCRGKRDDTGFRLWSRVAVEIARRTRHENGVKGAERYEQAAGVLPAARSRLENEVVHHTAEISRSLARIACCEHAPNELHNIGATVRNASALVRFEPAVQSAAVSLLAVAGRLIRWADEGNWLQPGIYQPMLEQAGQALERYRAVLFQTSRTS